MSSDAEASERLGRDALDVDWERARGMREEQAYYSKAPPRTRKRVEAA
jgi:hypothetical protein